jgi:hypothetical protein
MAPVFDGAGQKEKDSEEDNDMNNKKKPNIPRPPPPPETIPPRNTTAGDRDDWADLIVPPVPRVRPVGSAASARARAARRWWRPQRLP